VGLIDLRRGKIHPSLSRSDLKSCPKASSLTTVSEKKEKIVLGNSIISGPHIGPPGVGGFPAVVPGKLSGTRLGEDSDGGGTKIRILRKLLGYRIRHGENTLGVLEDFLLEDIFWILRYLVVRCRDGRKILIATDRVVTVSWFEQGLWVEVSEEEAEQAPEYNAGWLAENNRNAQSEAVSQ
jgi:hypothetical protein